MSVCWSKGFRCVLMHTIFSGVDVPGNSAQGQSVQKTQQLSDSAGLREQVKGQRLVCFRQTRPKWRCLSIRHKTQTQHISMNTSDHLSAPSSSERTVNSSVHRLGAEAQHKPGHQQTFLSPSQINMSFHVSHLF